MWQFVMLALAANANLAVDEIFPLSAADHDLRRDVRRAAEHRLNRNVQIWQGIDETGPNGLAQLVDFPAAVAPQRTLPTL